ncbi:hypothetical protein KCU78_g3385, partial [Aureobasidium melanogenum]
MATQADIDALSDKLSTARPLSWVIADCPVVALFKNHSAEGLGSLGQPLDRNGCGDLLRLWVGINEDADELFVTLTIRIRVSPVRKKTRRQGRLMFMVVPCNALQLQSAVVDYNDLGNKLSQYLFDMPSDTQSAKSKLLNISFDLGPHTSDVIMPAFQCRSNVMPQAMTLLRKLKSLSETSSFQLYTNLDESRLVAVQRVSNMLLNGHPIITPSLDTKGFYPGGRSACKNMWADQGWLEAGDKDTPGKESEVEKNQKELHIPFDPQPPPPYEPNSVPNHVPASPGPCGSPSLPRTTVNVSEQGLPATAPPNDSTPVRSVSQHHPQQLRAAKSDIAPPGVDRAFSRARNPPPSTSETSLSSDYTSTFLSGFPSQSPLPQIRDRLAAQIRAVATSSPFPSVQVAVSSAAERALDNDNVSTRVNTPTRIVDCVPDSTSRKRQPSYSLRASEITKRPTLSPMDEADDNLLRLLGPPPYQIEERHLERIFANYKPRDISIERLINAPPWIEQVGQNSRIYQLFWKNVPLIIPAETYLDPPSHLTGNIAPELASLGVDTPSDIAWNNVDNFINRYFLTPGSSWCDEGNQTIIFEIPLYWAFEDSAQDTFPRIDEDSIAAFLGTFEKLRCMHQYYRRRLTPIFIWKDARGDRMYSKQPNNKRNILPELGISQPMHAILEQALDMWADFLAGRLDTDIDQNAMHDHLSLFIRDHIEALYKDKAEKRGYMKYWMTRAFDCFSRPGMGMDRDMWSWAALNDGSIIQPDYNFLLPEDSDEDMEEDEGSEEDGEDDEEVLEEDEVEVGDEEINEDMDDDVEEYEEEEMEDEEDDDSAL